MRAISVRRPLSPPGDGPCVRPQRASTAPAAGRGMRALGEGRRCVACTRLSEAQPGRLLQAAAAWSVARPARGVCTSTPLELPQGSSPSYCCPNSALAFRGVPYRPVHASSSCRGLRALDRPTPDAARRKRAQRATLCIVGSLRLCGCRLGEQNKLENKSVFINFPHHSRVLDKPC